MGRIVTNKYINGDIVTTSDFYDGIVIENQEERKRIAMGRIILTNKNGFESIWILNENDEPKCVAQSSSAAIPSYIIEYITSAMTATKEYADSAIENGIAEYNALVVESGDTIYDELNGYISDVESRLEELSAYTMSMKFSDHFMITESEYIKLKTSGEIVVDGSFSGFSSETCRLNGLHIGDIVKYSRSIYYCIYNDGYTPTSGTTPTISGSTIEIQYEISGTTIILDDLVTISGTTLIFNEGSSGGDVVISGNTIDISSLSIDDGTTLVLNDNLTIDEENNTITIN